MAIQVADGFSLKSKAPLDARVKFNTLALMKAVVDADVYEGCFAYCAETDKYYKFLSTNTVDADTGKWREFESGGGGNELEITLNDYNDLPSAEKMNGTNYFITDGQSSPTLFSVQKAILAAGATSVQFNVPTSGNPLLTLYTSDPNVSYLAASVSSGVATYTFGARSNAMDVYLKIEVF